MEDHVRVLPLADARRRFCATSSTTGRAMSIAHDSADQTNPNPTKHQSEHRRFGVTVVVPERVFVEADVSAAIEAAADSISQVMDQLLALKRSP